MKTIVRPITQERLERKSFLWVFLLLIMSGNPFIKTTLTYELFYILIIPFLVYKLLKQKKPIFEKYGAIVFILFAITFLLQTIWFSFFPAITILGFFIRLYIGYAILRLVADFTTVYVQVMEKICLLGLTIWVIGKTGLLSPLISTLTPWNVYIWTDTVSYTIGIHTFFTNFNGDIKRNAGMFWEPGAFAGYINLAILFLSLKKDSYKVKEYKRYMTILLITLLSTMSSAGYLMAPIAIMFGFSLRAKTNSIRSFKAFVGIAILLLAILGGSFLFNKVEFLGDKIQEQLEKTENTSDAELGLNNTRFGSLQFDWFYFTTSPVFGNGLNPTTRYRYHPSDDDRVGGHGNGFSDFLAKFGVMGILILWVGIFLGFKSLTGKPVISIAVVIFLMLTLFSEPFLNYPLYLSLMFLNKVKKSPATREP